MPASITTHDAETLHTQLVDIPFLQGETRDNLLAKIDATETRIAAHTEYGRQFYDGIDADWLMLEAARACTPTLRAFASNVRPTRETAQAVTAKVAHLSERIVGSRLLEEPKLDRLTRLQLNKVAVLGAISWGIATHTQEVGASILPIIPTRATPDSVVTTLSPHDFTLRRGRGERRAIRVAMDTAPGLQIVRQAADVLAIDLDRLTPGTEPGRGANVVLTSLASSKFRRLGAILPGINAGLDIPQPRVGGKAITLPEPAHA